MESNFGDWFVIQVQSGLEKEILERLKNQNLTHLKPFLPLKTLKAHLSGVIKETHEPIYPGYLIIIGIWEPNEALKIAQIPGVYHFVGGISNPGKVKNDEKEIIMSLSSDLSLPDSKVMKCGTKIKILNGPLKQLEGFIESVDRRKKKVFLNLPLLGNRVRVSLGIDFVEATEC